MAIASEPTDEYFRQYMYLVIALTIVACVIVLCPLISAATVTATFSNDPIQDQAEDKRMGFHLPEGAGRASMNLYMNFLGDSDFEDGTSWFETIDSSKWGGDVTGLTLSYDTSTFYDGKQSLKVVATQQSALPGGFGQWESGRTFIPNRTYRFSCYMKQTGMPTQDNVEFRVYFPDGVPSCNVNARKKVSVTGDWQEHYMDFTVPNECWLKDPHPSLGNGANTKRINLYYAGTLWVDHCRLIDASLDTDWQISQNYIDNLIALRPGSLRYGGLGANKLTWDNLVGPALGRPKEVMGISEFLKLNELTGANPDYVISAVFSGEQYDNLLEYMFGDNETAYGSQRESYGYSSWKDSFPRFFFELGNELLCSDMYGCEWPPANYADWSTDKITRFMASTYWEPVRMLLGFNVWYDSTYLNSNTLKEEKANTGGGKAEFWMPAKYYSGRTPTVYNEQGTPTTYSESQVSVNKNLFFNRVLGEAEYARIYTLYQKEVVQTFYGKDLILGIYEYGPSGPLGSSLKDVWMLENSLGFGISWLDMSVMMKKTGMDPLGLFVYQGGFGKSPYYWQNSYSWPIMDDYPNIRKRPAYYAFKMYGQYQRGDFIEHTLSGNIETFDPFGPGANLVESYGCTRSHQSSCHNSNFGLSNWYYPLDVPYIQIYPFKSGGRYSYLIINRDLRATPTNVVFNIKNYAPSAKAELFMVTGSDPSLTNEDTENVNMQHQAITNFGDGYTLSVNPFSAYMLVNYAQGASVCLDEDGDGYGANEYETSGCAHPGLVDCVDFNPNIHPNGNSYCDCNKADGYYIGGFEKDDDLDNDCDGLVDEGFGGGPTCSSNSQCTDDNLCTYDLCKDSSCINKNANLDNGANIGLGDIIQVIAHWATTDSIADIDSNGNVGLSDVLAIIGLWSNYC
ncbi:MAG: carbohydrate binding domain-containing protein [Candidatus Altiarchaeota archaeon]|nr:carbohydrate binding domain-containing protein [Candidatus Altiarchaeota archaeon]